MTIYPLVLEAMLAWWGERCKHKHKSVCKKCAAWAEYDRLLDKSA